MPKLSFMKWYPADWINDTRNLSAEAKGCWIDVLCFMWNAPKRGVWTGTYQEFARATGTPWEAAARLVQELSSVCNVTRVDVCVTLVNRRMARQELHYETNTNRQKRFRERLSSNENVTLQTLDSSRLLKITKTTSNTVFDGLWLRYPKRLGKKAALRHYLASVKTPEDQTAITRAFDNYLRHIRGREIQYVQHGSTWFNNWQDWINYTEVKTDAPNGGTSIFEQIAKRNRENGTAENGAEPTAGEIFARIRDLPDIQPKT